MTSKATSRQRIWALFLLLLALAAAAVGFVMRLQDLRIHRELRRRRSGRDAEPG